MGAQKEPSVRQEKQYRLLTKEGEIAAEEAVKKRAKLHSDMLEELTEAEKTAFYDALKKIQHHYISTESQNE